MPEPTEPLLATKASYYLSISPELLADADATLAGWEKFVFGPSAPEERAEMEARRAAYEADRRKRHAAAVAEWQQVRDRHADSPAIVAVLDIHKPSPDGSLECTHPVSGWEADAEGWPCSTYEAIRDAA